MIKIISFGDTDYKVEFYNNSTINSIIDKIKNVNEEANKEMNNGNYYGGSNILSCNYQLIDELFKHCVHIWGACPVDRYEGIWHKIK